MPSTAEHDCDRTIQDTWAALSAPGLTPAAAMLEVAQECDCSLADVLQALPPVPRLRRVRRPPSGEGGRMRLALLGNGLDAVLNPAPGGHTPSDDDRAGRYYTALAMSGAVDPDHHGFRQAEGFSCLTALRSWWNQMEARRGH